MTQEEIHNILRVVEETYALAGKRVQTAVLSEGDTETLVIDNREETELN